MLQNYGRIIQTEHSVPSPYWVWLSRFVPTGHRVPVVDCIRPFPASWVFFFVPSRNHTSSRMWTFSDFHTYFYRALQPNQFEIITKTARYILVNKPKSRNQNPDQSQATNTFYKFCTFLLNSKTRREWTSTLEQIDTLRALKTLKKNPETKTHRSWNLFTTDSDHFQFVTAVGQWALFVASFFFLSIWKLWSLWHTFVQVGYLMWIIWIVKFVEWLSMLSI